MFLVIHSRLPRKNLYELFIRTHQTLATVIFVSALLHVSSSVSSKSYLYVALGIFGATFLIEGGLSLRSNMLFIPNSNNAGVRVGEIFAYPTEDDRSPIQVTILLQKPLSVRAGQYINICIPSLGLRSMMQSHPFVVASWTGKQQRKLELVIEPCGRWTKRLHSRASGLSGQNGGLGRVLFTGPHGIAVPVENYEYVLMIASGYGILAQLPLLERLVQGTLAREARARRIRLVWEFENIGQSPYMFRLNDLLANLGLYETIYPLLNWLLVEDRKLGNNCVSQKGWFYITR